MKRIRGSDFIQGDTPGGFAARLYLDEAHNIIGTVNITAQKQGPPGYAHGGSLAALLDEAMVAAGWNQGHAVMSVNLNINYRKAVPIQTDIEIFATIERKEGRKLFARGEIRLPDGTVAVEGTAILLEAPQYFYEGGVNPFGTME